MTVGLGHIQTLFQGRLLSDDREILDHLSDRGPFMKVYDQAYVMRLMEVMGEEFPAVHTLLGDDRFATAANDYIRTRPSTMRSVRWLGEGFPRWLRKTTPWQEIPVVSDMAAFEWALGLAFDAPDKPLLSIDTLATIAPEAWRDLRFDFHPALNTLELSFDVIAFQQAVAGDNEPEAMPEAFGRTTTWAVWRDSESLMARYRVLDSDEATGLSVLRHDGTFEALCDIATASGDPETAALRAAGYLRHWIDSGWITGLVADQMTCIN